MIDYPVDDLVGIVKQVAMTGSNCINLEIFQHLQGIQIVLHIAVRRIDDNGRSVNDVVARNEEMLAQLQIAQMIRCMPRCMYRL